MRKLLKGVVLLLSFCTLSAQAGDSDDLDLSFISSILDWSDWGQNINNTHHNIYSGISKYNLNNLIQLCAIDYRANPNDGNATIGAKPLIVKDVIYWSAQTGQIGAHKIVRDSSGNFLRCDKLWQQSVTDVVANGLNGLTSRGSPAYYKRSNGRGTLLYLTPSHAFDFLLAGQYQFLFTYQPTAYALDAETGQKLWQVPVARSGAESPDDVLLTTTSSPRVYKGYAYFGMASYNNLKGFLLPAGFPQTARGHMIRLDLKINGGTPTFENDVKTLYTVPKKPANYQGNRWFAGGGVWASAPSIIPTGGKGNKGLIIFSSGQLYDYPEFVGDCMKHVLDQPIIIEGQPFSKRGETGGGSEECLKKANEQLVALGVDIKKEPLANNSVIAINMADFTHAWHVNTNGIDAWQVPCGLALDTGSPDCTVEVPGPDWDVGGNSPIVARYDFQTVVISHNKGGELFWINPFNGKLLKHADVCVASAVGGIHWGFTYDPIQKTLLVSCSGANVAEAQNYNTTIANGQTYCRTSILNGIDVRTGALKWQAVGPRPISSPSADCPVGKDVIDERFKYGKNFDVVIKNTFIPGVPVKYMPDSPQIPVNEQGSRGDGIPSSSQGIVYWPIHNGAVYALDVQSGDFLQNFFCDVGGIYTSAPSVAEGYIAFGCGRRGVFGDLTDASGHSIMIYGKQKTGLFGF